MTDVVLLDIEGTVSPISAVRDTLFGYAHQRIMAAMTDPDVREAIGPVDIEDLLRWSRDDIKEPQLKTLQGLIWEQGFAAGDLTSSMYDDVPSALEQLSRSGSRLCVYSSGSVLAQRLWFEHTAHGDLTGLIEAWFDLAVGPKSEQGSYLAIAESLGVAPSRVRFLSDVTAELDAAADAGMQTVGVSRVDEGHPDTGRHTRIESFQELLRGENSAT